MVGDWFGCPSGTMHVEDRDAFLRLHGAMCLGAQRVGVELRYGGDWDGDGVYGERGESDLVHWELKR